MKHTAISWAFSTENQSEGFEREQHALETLERADPEFARALAARIVPTPAESEPDVIRRVVP